jgi:hypothetical protein
MGYSESLAMLMIIKELARDHREVEQRIFGEGACAAAVATTGKGERQAFPREVPS